MKRYHFVVCGGTFDHFHKGHESFLSYQFSIAEKVVVGVAVDSFIRQKEYVFSLEPFKLRKQSIEAFCKKKGFFNRVKIVPIDSVFIPKEAEEFPIEAIVVTKQTQKGANLINASRQLASRKKLDVIVHPFVLGEDGLPISSARIRKGEINREGRSYVKDSWILKDRKLPVFLRSAFQKPFGELMEKSVFEKTFFDSLLLVTVGDIITYFSHKRGLTPRISVVDFHEKRKKRFQTLREIGFLGTERVVYIKNPAGTLTASLFQCSRDMFFFSKEKRSVVVVEGEEDLAVLPFVLASPLGYTILYGQPDEGIVRVDINEETKEKAFSLAKRFRQIP